MKLRLGLGGRRRIKDDLEQRVLQRTQELADANRALEARVAEHQRAEALQAALFHLAQLATADLDEEEFYDRVHQEIGKLLHAENFFIGLVDTSSSTLTFPYYTDVVSGPHEARPFGLGLSEYVIATGPLLIDRAGLEAMSRSGLIDLETEESIPTCWLGVPLVVGDAVIGLVALQSYSASIAYSPTDQDLLSFVAIQIAISIYRRRSTAALSQAKLQLEQRVEERTRELRLLIAEYERVQEQLKHQVMHDALTGLASRSLLRDRLDRALGMLQRDPERRFALLYLDIDYFKKINDSLGHLNGDEFLKEIARRMQLCVRDPDVVARLSGDEFAVLLENITTPETAMSVANRLLQELRKPLQVAGKDLEPSASIGVAVCDGRYESIDSVLHDADAALYRSKEQGRNRCEMFDPTWA